MSARMRAFFSKQSVLWLVGVFVLVAGFLIAAVILPSTSFKKEKVEGADVQVPKLQNVPPPGTPKMRLEAEKEQSPR